MLNYGPNIWSFCLNLTCNLQELKNQGVHENRLELLKGVSGALMGVGKTTLMDVLTGWKIGGYIGGNIIISGNP